MPPRDDGNMIFMTDVDDRAVITRGKIKGVFLEQDKQQMTGYIRDLEKTLAINKQIISELLEKDSTESKSRKVIEKLNNENAELQSQLKVAIKERSQCQARLLISEQILEEYKSKEETLEKEHKEKVVELTDQLNRKEFVLQNCQRRYEKAQVLLKRFSHKDQEIRRALKELNFDGRFERRITNTVEDNERMRKELTQKTEKIATLEQRVQDLEEAKSRLDCLLEECYKIQESYQRRVSLQLRATADSGLGETSDRGKIQGLEDELEKTQSKMQNLYRLNVRLSKALEVADEKLGRLKSEAQGCGTKRHKSTVVCTPHGLNLGNFDVIQGPHRRDSEANSEHQSEPPKTARGPATKPLQSADIEGNRSFGIRHAPDDCFSELSSIEDEAANNPGTGDEEEAKF